MRLAFVLTLLVTLGLCSGIAMADKDKPDEPIWQYWVGPDRDTYPEQEPNDTCDAPQDITCGDVIDPGELVTADRDWYRFYANAGDPLTLGTAPSGDLPTVDTYLELWNETCDQQLAYDDDGGPGLYSLIQMTASYTGNYNMLVRGYSDNSTGYYMAYTYCAPLPTGACCFEDGSCVVYNMIDCGEAGGDYYGDDTVCDPNPCPQPPPPPENDTCEGAEQYGYTIERCTAGTMEGTTRYANPDYSPTNYCTGYSQAAGKDMVWYMDLEEGDVVDMVYTETGYDAAFYILADCADMNSCVVGADDPEEFVWTVTATGRYYLVLDGYSTYDEGGPWILDWVITCPGPPLGACCYGDQLCAELTEEDCWAMPEDYLWIEGEVCDPNPCPPVATETTTWGDIKSTYR